MKIIKKIKIKSDIDKHRQIRIYNVPVIEYKTGKNKFFKLFPLYKRDNSHPAIYLKVNAIKYFSLACIKHWINIVEQLGYDYYIICDKKQVQEKIEESIIFPNGNIKFIKSHTSLKQKLLAKKFSDKNWYKAALAHMTTFWHSKKIDAEYFWNIDADDTAFLIEADKVAKILLEVEQYAKDNKIPIFSLDMWRSWSQAKHWSFGITFTSNNTNWLEIFKKANRNWFHFYDNYRLDVTNLDWFFTYLKDACKMDIKTFYIENMRFIHFCEFGGRKKDGGLCYWENKKIHYPLYEYVLKDETIGVLPIPEEIIQFKSDANEEYCLNFYKCNIRGKK